jgi:two-component system chemotaxis sensor kinase CheA
MKEPGSRSSHRRNAGYRQGRGVRDELERRLDVLEFILERNGQGFVVFDLDGSFEDHARVLESWLGPVPPTRDVGDWLRTVAPDVARHVEVGLATLREELTPEGSLAQLPRRIHARGRTLSVQYEWKEQRIVAVLSEVAKSTAAAQRDAARAAELGLVERMMRDREGFLEFFAEADRIVSIAIDPWAEDIERRRALHTLRGICPMFGLSVVADVCADIEDASSLNQPIDEYAITSLRILWLEAQANVRKLAGDDDRPRVQLSMAEHARLREQVRTGTPPDLLEHAIDELLLDSVEDRLLRLADQARILASQAGRAPLQVTVDASPIRVPHQGWSALWSALVHVMRNAVDHGLETIAERSAANKPERATLTLRARADARAIQLEIVDDGRGVDWAAVAKRAAERGLAHATRADLQDALFSDGLSTKKRADTLSGRGIGMGAVREAARALDGHVTVESEVGEGLRIRLEIPRP